jgi:hypothetical protein
MIQNDDLKIYKTYPMWLIKQASKDAKTQFYEFL